MNVRVQFLMLMGFWLLSLHPFVFSTSNLLQHSMQLPAYPPSGLRVMCVCVPAHLQFFVFIGFWLPILHQFVFTTSNLLQHCNFQTLKSVCHVYV